MDQQNQSSLEKASLRNVITANFWKSVLSVGAVLLLAGSLAGAAGYFAYSAKQVDQVNLRDNVAPPKGLQHLAFGFHEVMADSLWIRALQDFDYCEKKLAENLCSGRSWLFQMLDVITDLSPHFYIVYLIGPLTLSVIISDVEGATALFEKAIQYFPKDWKILYRAAYHAATEEKDFNKAGALAQSAAQNGAPPWLYSFAAEMFKKDGQGKAIELMLRSLEEQKAPPEIIERVRKRLQSK